MPYCIQEMTIRNIVEDDSMTLGEKIFDLRKRSGWSQEELAEKCEVSRQSVSKWESGQSVPDLDKILMISNIFQVSTDYLLKEDYEDYHPEPETQADHGNPYGMGAYADTEKMDDVYEDVYPDGKRQNIRLLSDDEVYDYFDTLAVSAPKIATGVFFCIVSPVTLILLAVLSEGGFLLYGRNSIAYAENISGGIGVVVLLVLVAIAVLLFIPTGMKLQRFEYLEKEPFELENAMEQEIRRKKEDFSPVFTRMITLGVVLIILAVVPLIVAGCLGAGDLICGILAAALLGLIAIGVYLFVWAGMYHDGYQKLLQEEDYTRRNKKASGLIDRVGAVYWPCIIVIFLAYSFVSGNWGFSWIIWPIAGVGFSVVSGICKAIKGK